MTQIDADVSAPPAGETSTVLVAFMGVEHSSPTGFIHGGTIMKLCDEAAGMAAMRYSRSAVVTAAVDRMTFLLPVNMGDMVTFRASVNAVWRSSMEVGVRVEAERPRSGEVLHTHSAYFTMVVLDEDRRPAPAPPLPPGDGEAERRRGDAELRRRNRLAEREHLKADRRAKGEDT